MAESLDDGEFWLPPQFLSDDMLGFVEADSDAAALKKGFFSFDSTFGGFGSLGSSSDLSSPSTETESDEDDFAAGLTLQMARSNIIGRCQPSFAPDNTKGRSVAGSPQSTLCAVGSGCVSRHGSGGGSPNGPCQVSSPPATWDLLYAAAGEVARMRMNSEDRFGLNKSNMGFVAPPRKPSPINVPPKTPNPDGGFCPQPSLSQQRLQAAKFNLLKQQQMLKQKQLQLQRAGILGGHGKGTGHFQPQQVVQNRARNSDFIGANKSSRPMGLAPPAWPPLQQQIQPNGSGMRAMFLGGPRAKRECAGTGVFLPRRKVGASETRKKPACSTVLLPARVVQALNLNLEQMGPEAQVLPRFNAGHAARNDVCVRLRSGTVVNPQRQGNNNSNCPRSQPGMSHEIRLPQEWTY